MSEKRMYVPSEGRIEEIVVNGGYRPPATSEEVVSDTGGAEVDDPPLIRGTTVFSAPSRPLPDDFSLESPVAPT